MELVCLQWWVPFHEPHQHKELVRAAGRAAVEESLLSKSHGIKRKASEMSAAGIVAQWQAYAEVYGTNGMAAGGARSALVESAAPDALVSDEEESVPTAGPSESGVDQVVEDEGPTNKPLAPLQGERKCATAADKPAERMCWDF